MEPERFRKFRMELSYHGEAATYLSDQRQLELIAHWITLTGNTQRTVHDVMRALKHQFGDLNSWFKDGNWWTHSGTNDHQTAALESIEIDQHRPNQSARH